METKTNVKLTNVGSDSIIKIPSREDVNSIFDYIREPLKNPTPKEKVKKRPDGYDYVESAWMDKSFKTFSPLYNIELVHRSEAMGWITYVVAVTDRITGNTELGAGAARVQVRRGAESPTFRDIIDKGNNEAAGLSKAIKNAQSRFGHASDIYKKRQELPTDDEKSRFDNMLVQIKTINPTRAETFKIQWSELGTDFSQYLDNWQMYIERYNSKSVDTNKKQTII